jgi:hypothetical protein
LDRTWAIENNAVTPWMSPEGRPRFIVDADGIEWEVYDESTWTIELALDWEFLPQTESPGLIFSSRTDRRRMWPCPPAWRSLADRQLLEILGRAKSVH